jgi:hypothetical protein
MMTSTKILRLRPRVFRYRTDGALSNCGHDRRSNRNYSVRVLLVSCLWPVIGGIEVRGTKPLPLTDAKQFPLARVVAAVGERGLTNGDDGTAMYVQTSIQLFNQLQRMQMPSDLS